VANIKKIVVQWQGLQALPGVSVFYASSGSTNPVSDLNTFFTALRPLFPTALGWVLPGSGDSIDEQTGHVQASGWSSTGAGTITCTGGAVANTLGTGGKVIWLTAGLTTKFRRVKGHTNFTSLINTCYTATGVLTAGTMTSINTPATALVGTGNFGVWHRNTPGSTDGFFSSMTSAVVPSTVISLRSRRY